MWIVEQGNWQLAAILYGLGCIGFASGNVFYDSLLPSIAKKKDLDFVSSLGFVIGYLGGGILFVLNILMYQNPQWFGISDATTAIRLSFVTVGIWWAIFSIPIFLFVPEKKIINNNSFGQTISLGWNQLKTTFIEIKQMKKLMQKLFI